MQLITWKPSQQLEISISFPEKTKIQPKEP